MRLQLVGLIIFCTFFSCRGSSNHEEDKGTFETVAHSGKPGVDTGSKEGPAKRFRMFLGDEDNIVDKKKADQPGDTTIQAHIDSIKKVGFLVENSLPEGYVKDGTVDYSSYLQNAVNTHNIVVFPGFPILVNEKGLKIPSNREILFLAGSKLILKPNNKANYRIINISGASNINLYDPVVVGDRYQHIGTDGEWGMGISIISSSNINVYHADISNCWGDGIYIGQSQDGPPPDNITITDVYAHSNRRNGITLVSGVNIKLVSPRATNADGALPMAGIDIEPNNAQAELKNIQIVKPYTADNKGKGIQIGLGRFIRNGIKPVSIEVSDHVDVGSATAMVLSCNPAFITNALPGNGNSKGYIKISNPVWEKNSQGPLRASGFRTEKILFQVTNPKIIDQSNNKMTNSAINSLLRKAIGTGGAIELND